MDRQGEFAGYAAPGVVPAAGPETQQVASGPGAGAPPSAAVAPVAAPAPVATPNVHVNVAVGGPTIVVAPASHGPAFVVRALWFLCVGWWLTGITIGIAYAAALTVIGLPLTFYLANRLPAILTLRARKQEFVATVQNGVTMLKQQTIAQHPLWLRAVYFLCVGFWLGGVWLTLAYLLCLTVFLLPLGVMMFDRVGGVMTLLRH